MEEFRLHVRRDRSSSVLCWVRNDDVNGALVGWWKCWWWCFSPEPRRCASSLSKASPALWYHVSPVACSTLARAPTFILPSGRNTCICQNGGRMEAKERKNVSHRSEVQPWRNWAESSVGAWTLWACVYLCLNKKKYLWKTVVWRKVSTNADGL